ncbi:MAG: hypothetical protein AAF411_26750 [Myxococcota bacterium]
MLKCSLNWKRIDVVGDDRLEWLGGQITTNLAGLETGEARPGLLLTAKGKTLTDLWVLASEDRLHLSLPAPALEEAIARLERYLVMEDVDLEVAEVSLLSVQGPGAAEALRAQTDAPLWPVPRFGKEGAECWLEPDVLADVLTKLGGASDEAAWNDARVAAGRPALGSELAGRVLPQELGLYDHISFNKGCYIGQEPVVMLEHRGKPPKRLVRVQGRALSAGAAVQRDDKDVATLTSASSDGSQALALVPRRHLDSTLSVNGQEVAVEVLRFDRAEAPAPA